MRRTRLALAVVVAVLGCGYWAAQASASVYWTNYSGNTIGRANLDGSDPVQSFITGASGPEGLAVDGE
jgi:hypothetical protein